MIVRIFFILLLLCNCNIVIAGTPVVIANGDVTQSSIDHTELVDIFTRKKLFWNDGHRISVFIKPINSVEHKIFTINILQITPYKYKTLSDEITWTGSNTVPHEIATDEEMMLKLSQTPYSVGYLNYNTVVVHTGSNDIIYIKVD